MYGCVSAIVFYFGFKPVLAAMCCKWGTTGTSLPFVSFVLIHNWMLVWFSAHVCYNCWWDIYNSLTEYGLRDTYCNLFSERLAYAFYLSKLYEFVDTGILVVKRKKVPLLQLYHHPGAALTMWGLWYTKSSGVMIFMALNSFVHTVMYTYYFFSALHIRLPGKRWVTNMQLIQFFVGMLVTLPIYTCQTFSQKVALTAVYAYIMPLLGLFANFYRNCYLRTEINSVSSGTSKRPPPYQTQWLPKFPR